jgi:hypothetical protein
MTTIASIHLTRSERIVMKILLWLILLVLCWPLALFALILYPIIWLLLIPFRLIGITVTAVLDFVKAVITLPARLLKKI